jgi:hypothetical protein
MKSLLFALFMAGCSAATYTRTNPDGSTVSVSGYELGTDKALSGFRYDGDGHGAVKMSVDGLDQNQTNGLAQVNQFVQSVVEGAVRGAK